MAHTLKITSSDIELSGDGATIRLADGAANDTGKKPFLNTAGQVHVIYVTGTESERIRKLRITGLTVDGNIYKQSGYYNPRGIVFEHAEPVGPSCGLVDALHLDPGHAGPQLPLTAR